MARSTATLLAQLRRFLPPGYAAAEPLLAGLAAELAEVETAGDALVDATTVAGASGIWLTLLARGYGLRRATDESDASLRARLVAPEAQVTRAAILAAVNAILAEYTVEEAVLVEHWAAEGYADIDCWADQTPIYDQHNAFTLECPIVGSFPTPGSEHAVYGIIAAAAEAMRAAGVRWWLVVDPA